jgi:hypothetical protein
MNLNKGIKQILLEINRSDDSEDEIEKNLSFILQSGKWEDVRNGILNILYEDDKELWDEAIKIIFYLQNRSFIFEETKTIALLYDCLSLSNSLDSNLVWTITRKIKSLPYLSDYEPYSDSIIIKEMEQIKENRIKINNTFDKH